MGSLIMRLLVAFTAAAGSCATNGHEDQASFAPYVVSLYGTCIELCATNGHEDQASFAPYVVLLYGTCIRIEL